MNILAGFLSGVAGAMGLGGGSVLLLYLTLFLAEPQLKSQGINLLFFIPCAIISLLWHHKNKLVHWKLVFPMAIGGVIGVLLGIWLVSMMPSSLLGKIFGAFLLLFGGIECFKKDDR